MSGTWPANGPIPPDPDCPCLHCRSIPRPFTELVVEVRQTPEFQAAQAVEYPWDNPVDLFDKLEEFSQKWGHQFPPRQEGTQDG